MKTNEHTQVYYNKLLNRDDVSFPRNIASVYRKTKIRKQNKKSTYEKKLRAV